ncbi:MAG: hypothetical protein JRH11_12300, partial [Deltaproteobacteria bacterium]|nr:hypothetical protein [Deltaproteobacteria bacterium]
MSVPALRTAPLGPLLLLILAAAPVAACGDDAPPRREAPEIMLAGPFAGEFALTDATRLRLPVGEEQLASGDVALVYWYAPEAAGGSLSFEVRAEATALAQGTVIHREQTPIPAGRQQGFFAVDPREL